jgi:DNA processing protein
MENDLLYRIALTRVQGIGALRTKILIRHFGDAAAVFRASPAALENIRGIGNVVAKAIKAFRDFSFAEQELAFVEKYKIRPLSFTDPGYPRRLLKNRLAPALLFYKGTADLNAAKVLSVVGTRTPTEYGRQLTDRIIAALVQPDLLVVSGLAYGIDAAAHRAALRHQLSTVGVLGHGLDRIYPEQHAGLAREMLRTGGLLTGFTSGTEPDEHNFPMRNRIVGGMSDALLVVETDCRGGSMLTVDNALGSHKKVFAIPGRISDRKSAGCNALIQQGKAILLTGPEQLLQELGWEGQAAQTAYTPQPAVRPLPFRPSSLHAARQTRGPSSSGPASSRQAKRSTSSRSVKSSAAYRPAQGSTPSSSLPIPVCYAQEVPLASLSKEENVLLGLLRQTGGLTLDDLLARKDPGGNQVSLSLLNLEMQGLIACMPGKRYIPV